MTPLQALDVLFKALDAATLKGGSFGLNDTATIMNAINVIREELNKKESKKNTEK